MISYEPPRPHSLSIIRSVSIREDVDMTETRRGSSDGFHGTMEANREAELSSFAPTARIKATELPWSQLKNATASEAAASSPSLFQLSIWLDPNATVPQPLIWFCFLFLSPPRDYLDIHLWIKRRCPTPSLLHPLSLSPSFHFSLSLSHRPLVSRGSPG